MKVLQIIDSLRPGGAEKVAISYANGLLTCIEASFLCCTREEGLLKNKLSPEVGYLFLEKKNSLDFVAFLKLRRFIVKNKINVIQAHGTSYFLSTWIKISLPEVKLIWHDHYGRNLKERKSGILTVFSKKIDGIISVNTSLKNWAEEYLNCPRTEYFPNFLPQTTPISSKETVLKGNADSKIICVANLRPQKDHLNLLKAFLVVTQKIRNVSLHLVGKDNKDFYSEEIKAFISLHGLEEKVFIYGEQEDVEAFYGEADLGVLASKSEGLPVSLLEYGKAGLPVVCTQVGECAAVIGKFGKVVPVNDTEALAGAILAYLENKGMRDTDAQNFQQKVLAEYSEEAILPRVVAFYNSLK